MTVKPEEARLATVAALFRELTHSQGWACFSDEIGGMILASVERLIQTPDPRVAGYIEGLRATLTLPDVIIRRSKHP